MRELAVLFLHLLATVARLAVPGGARAVVAEFMLVKQQLLILNRSRKRSPHLRFSDRLVDAVCALPCARAGYPFHDHPQTLNALEPALSADPANTSAALLLPGADEVRSKGTHPRKSWPRSST